MKHNSGQEMLDYIYETYLEFGTYGIQDKNQVDAFDFGVTDMTSYKKAAKMLASAVEAGHPHLTAFDVAWAGESVKYPVTKRLLELPDDEFDAFLLEMTDACSVVTDEKARNELLCRLTEV